MKYYVLYMYQVRMIKLRGALKTVKIAVNSEPKIKFERAAIFTETGAIELDTHLRYACAAKM